MFFIRMSSQRSCAKMGTKIRNSRVGGAQVIHRAHKQEEGWNQTSQRLLGYFGMRHICLQAHLGWQSLFSCCSWPSGQAGWELVSGLFSPLHHHCLAKLTISSTHELLFQATLTPLCPLPPNLQHLVSPNHALANSSPLLHIKGGGPGRIRDQNNAWEISACF